MSVELLDGRKKKWCGVLRIEKVGVEWKIHCKLNSIVKDVTLYT
jgi:hypothetical protein